MPSAGASSYGSAKRPTQSRLLAYTDESAFQPFRRSVSGAVIGATRLNGWRAIIDVTVAPVSCKHCGIFELKPSPRDTIRA